ncbi:phosphomevalonate kinase-like [Babylonia areolata]|uniref:phosphomevalonate kinase-like n=1 Tax=Babylonia areolata TaxID=304850 RepID=UPI003FD46A18
MMAGPRCVVLLSGKRKTGKDYVANILQTRFTSEVCSIMRLSAPLKSQYAKEHNLDFSRLLDASEYKEHYRADMIRWGEERRNQDPAFFCQLAIQGPGADNPVWVISDARRLTDLQYFREHYPQTVTVRLEAEEAVRIERGFVFTPGVDDAESECGLDGVKDWDWRLKNNHHQELEDQLTLLLNHVQSTLS